MSSYHFLLLFTVIGHAFLEAALFPTKPAVMGEFSVSWCCSLSCTSAEDLMGRPRRKVRDEGSSARLTHPSAAAWQRKKKPCAGEVRTKERETERAKKKTDRRYREREGGWGKDGGIDRAVGRKKQTGWLFLKCARARHTAAGLAKPGMLQQASKKSPPLLYAGTWELRMEGSREREKHSNREGCSALLDSSSQVLS